MAQSMRLGRFLSILCHLPDEFPGRAFQFYPTGPFTTLEPRDQEMGEFYAVQKRRATDFEDIKF